MSVHCHLLRNMNETLIIDLIREHDLHRVVRWIFIANSHENKNSHDPTLLH